MAQRRPLLSKAEWQLMNLCWKLGRSTARQIYEASLEQKRRDYQTVKTLLDRMAAKGYLRVEKLGRLCLFRPAVKRSRTVAAAIEEFLGTVLDNTPAPLFLHLTRKGRMTSRESGVCRVETLTNERWNWRRLWKVISVPILDS